ncbi:hypothetical protein Glove_292g36 [Diversispora epigaea]|uniref:SNRNP25 ubiquitin-like domain-containing protein n=1 Tax=Diversispora epigaea TaxID=1348612 RepID=A0A397I145_9GLOM|nr:hypothetical protein Glove_292g36 [Diversispora epigaea]
MVNRDRVDRVGLYAKIFMNYRTDQADQTDQTQPYFVPTVPPPPLPPLPPSECPPHPLPISSPNLTTSFIDPSFSPADNPNNPEISITDDDDNRSKLRLGESDVKKKKKKSEKEKEVVEEKEEEEEKEKGERKKEVKEEGGEGEEVDNTSKLSQTQKMLQQLLKDPLLSDLAKLNSEGNISLEEVDTLIALETGTAFEIEIERDGLEPFLLVVRQNSTIADLKKLIRLNFERQQRKQNIGLGRIKKSSWKYVWKTYCLMFENKRLLQDKMPLQEYGIRSGNVLKFSRFIGKQRKEVNKK